ncbi:MAG: hypothetical protein LBP23_03535 [Treponema sp.]|jgi:hypothetical protein|nr:hypothetical protein [Treponema sp.]
MTFRPVSLTAAGFFICVSVLLSVSCASVPDRNFNEDKMFADVIGFHDGVNASYRLYHLTSDGAGQEKLEESTRALPIGTNTSIYYAVDKALDRIQAVYNNTPSNPLSSSISTGYYTKYYEAVPKLQFWNSNL